MPAGHWPSGADPHYNRPNSNRKPKKKSPMTNSPLLSSNVPRKHSILFFLMLVAFGAAGNYFKYTIFLNIDFLFGSIFAMLALQFFGVGKGILAASIIAGYTYVLWNHPYAIIILTAEVAAVGWLSERRKVGLVLADMLYWLTLGMPLVYLFYHGVMHVPPSSVYITMMKQAINGVTNVLIARMVYTGYTLRSRTALTSYREIVYNLLTSFVLVPALVLLMISSRTDFNEIVLDIKSSLTENIEHEHLILDDWAADRKAAIVNLARMSAAKTPQQLQGHVEQAAKVDHNFLQVGLFDKKGTATAHFPLKDDRGGRIIGQSFADQPFVPILKRTLKPMLSEVVMDNSSLPEPVVTMLVPIVSKGEYNGHLSGILNLEHVRQHLDKSMSVNHTLYTLIDRSGNIIMTNRADQKVMAPYYRGEGALARVDERINLWTQKLPANTPMSERWKKSFYMVEAGIGDHDEWKLILEQPVAPFQKALYEKYTNRMVLLFIILIVVLILAETISRKSVRSLEQLNQITRHLPDQIMNNAAIKWPESSIYEVHSQINNFRETAAALVQQFRKIQVINMSLEKRVEKRTKALVESELFFKESQRAAFIGSYKADFIAGHWDSSEVLDSILGIDKEYVRDLHGWLALIHPDDAAMFDQQAFEDLVSRRKPVTKEFRVVRKENGEMRWVVGSGEATFDSTGKILYLTGTVQDITDRKLEQEKLQRSENKFSQLLQSTNQGICGIDLDGRCTFINNAALDMLGYTLEDCLGQNMHRLVHHTPADGVPDSEEVCPIFHADTTGAGCRVDNAVMWKSDGTSLPVEYSSHPVTENGTIVGAVAVFTDITERKQQEKERQLLERQFQEAQKYECFGVLASGIAHDFNNILAIIMGQCSLAKLDSAYPLPYTSEIEKAAARGADLCRQLLIYSGKVNVNKTLIDLKSIVAEMVNLLKATLPQNVEISFGCLSDAPLVNGDASQIRQIIMNLIINASEAIGSRDGMIKIVLSDEIITEDTPMTDIQFNNINPGRYVGLEVADNGCGMDEELLQRIFEPFYTTKSTGRGLGTSAILGVVKSHNGALTLSSIRGSGTIFKIFIPAGAAPLAEEDVLHSTPQESWKGCGTVLLVDDEETILLSLGYMLKKLGFSVIEAQNGKEALDLFRQHHSDIVLVLTDVGMPVMNGKDLYQELKRQRPQLPIIVSSGYAYTDITSHIEEGFVAGLLTKPYSFEELQVVVKTALESA